MEKKNSTTHNNLTLLVDGGWLMMRSLFFQEKGFSKSASEAMKAEASQEFQVSLAQSVSHILRVIPEIDNIVLVTEGGSWRKRLPIPGSLGDITYKGTRVRRDDLDWEAIYGSFQEWVNRGMKENAGITVSSSYNIEGDDWAWYWSRRLSSEGTNVMIWTADGDLKQLVRRTPDNTFVLWYNNKELLLPPQCAWPEDPIEAMLYPPVSNSVLEALGRRLPRRSYVKPEDIVMNKVLCGDKGDNIMPVVRFQKNGKNYGFSQKDYEELMENLKITSLTDLIGREDQVSTYIQNTKKFKPYHLNVNQITEMLHYNLQMVWLDESQIPSSVITSMIANSTEYLHPDIDSLRSNYKIMLPGPDNKDKGGTQMSIEDIFDGI